MVKINRLHLHGFKSFAKPLDLEFMDGFNICIGANGSGKCLKGDSLVHLADGTLMRIDELINQKLETNPTQRLDDGIIALGDSTKVLSLDMDTLKIRPRPIQAYVKRKSPQKLLFVKTRSGKKIMATTYHPLFTLSNNQVTAVKTEELEPGMRIAIPRVEQIKEVFPYFTELLDLITKEDRLYVPYSESFEKILHRAKKGTWKELADQIGVPVIVIDGLLGKQAINFHYLVKILRYANLSEMEIIKLIPAVKSKNYPLLCNIPWKNNKDFARFFGYLLAEGRFPLHSDQVWFTNGNEDLVQDYASCIKKLFGVRYTINEYKPSVWDVLAYSSPLRTLLVKFGMALGGTLHKTATNLFLKHSSDEELGEFLNGLYSGDGHVSSSSIEITTKSPKLAHAIEYILSRLGIIYTTRDVLKIATNSGFSGWYKTITISGVSNAIAFKEFVQLKHKKKHERLLALCGKKANPNIDILEVNSLIKEIIKHQHIPVKKYKKEFSILDSYCYTDTMPSRAGAATLLQHVFSQYKSTAEVEQLKKLTFSDIFWDEIAEIEEVDSGEEWVYDLCVERDHNFIANGFLVHNSNIMDGLCFVLGKLSAKSMRAEKSANLIFNGGKQGSPMKEAEVSIFFDNGKGEFPIQGNPHPPQEVKVSRIIKHNGNSVYKINDDVRTRQQVLELLAGAKIDPDGHNIILQGDIVRFMEMHPEERRGLIEEISGISMYEDRKHKAMNELTKVDGKLNEATIILNEREAYLRELKKDRDHALKYKELEGNIKSNKATYLHLQITEKEKKVEHADERIAKQQEKMDKIKEKTQHLRKEIESHKATIEKITKDIENRSERESVALQREIDEVRGKLLQSRERFTMVQSELAKMEERVKQLEGGVQDTDRAVHDLEQRKKEAQQRLHTLQQQEKNVETDIQNLRKKHLGGMSEEFTALEKEITAQEGKLDKAQDKLQNVMQTRFSVDAKAATIEEQLQRYKALQKEHDPDKLRHQLKRIEEQLGKTFIEESSSLAQLKEAQRALHGKEQELARCQARASGIKESLSMDRAVDTILNLRREASFAKKIFGTVSQLGRADEQYALALEVAAGGRMKSIVVDSDETAAKCIALLKEKKSGIATFLPLNKMSTKQRTIPLKGKGIHGAALDLITYDQQFKPVFSHVFGGTLVVDDVATARRIGIGKARMVTLDGDVMETSGAMIGGHRIRQVGLHFQEKKEGGMVKDAEKDIDDLLKKTSFLEKRRADLEEKTATLRTEKNALEGQLVKIEASLGGIDLRSLAAEEQQLKKHSVYKEQESLEQEIYGLHKKIQQLREQRDALRPGTTGKAPTLLEKAEQLRSGIREEIVQLQTEMKNMQLQIDNIYLPEKEKTKQIIKQHQKELQEFKMEEEKLAEHITTFSASLQTMEKKEEKFKQDYKDLFHQRNKLSENIQQGELKIAEEERSTADIQDAINKLAIEKAKYTAEKEALDREYEEFRGVALRHNVALEKLKDEIKKFEQMLQQIGSVNMRALEVYEDIRKEYEGLLNKVAGLQKEKDDVLHLMHEIDSKKKDTFMKTFTVLAKNFTAIFSQLSTKGEASLDLENKDDPLNGGVDILVRLVGNKYLDIKSLSGGEKTLAALAFIFAIQEHQPAHFYLLDEVDAALDKTNSDLLSKLISKYSKTAQYILISHNDTMISEADTIYGVSMQETGISKVVSLKV